MSHWRLLNEIVEELWVFIHTYLMGFAYMLSPASNKPGSWNGGDTKIKLKTYYQEYQVKDCEEEIEQYLNVWTNALVAIRSSTITKYCCTYF